MLQTRDGLSIGTASATKGAKGVGFLTVAETNDGAPVQVPVAIVNGSAPGPVVWVQSGIHGSEYVGMGAIQRIVQLLDPCEVRGTLVAIPMVNILAYRAGSRTAPADGQDMNRIFPGRPLEQATDFVGHSEVIVHQLFTRVKQMAQFVVDCHDGGPWMTMAPLAQYLSGGLEYDGISKGMARAAALDLVWRMDREEVMEKAPGSLLLACADRGIPACSMEVGGQGRLDECDVRRATEAIVGILQYLDVIPEKRMPPVTQIMVKRGHRLRPPVGGVLWSRAKLLDRVERGQVVQVITDLFGNEKARLTAPIDGMVVALRTCGMVNTGDYCSNVGEIE